MKNRRLICERLEARMVPSGISAPVDSEMVVAEPNCDVAFTLEVTDESGNTRTSFRPGERINVDIMVIDCRDGALGTFAAALDLIYDDVRAHLDKQVHFGSAFPNFHSVDCQLPGIIDELIAMSGIVPTGAGPKLLAQLSFVATEPGEVVFRTDPADDLPWNEVLVYGRDTAVPLQRTNYGAATIVITEADSDDKERVSADHLRDLEVALKPPSTESFESPKVRRPTSRLTNIATSTMPWAWSESPGVAREQPVFSVQGSSVNFSAIGKSRGHRPPSVREPEFLPDADLSADAASSPFDAIRGIRPATRNG